MSKKPNYNFLISIIILHFVVIHLSADGPSSSILSTANDHAIEQAVSKFLSQKADTINFSYPLGFSEKNFFAYIEKTIVPFRPDIRYRLNIISDANNVIFQGCDLYIGSHFNGDAGIGGNSWNDPKFSVESYVNIMSTELSTILKKFGITATNLNITQFRARNATAIPTGTINILEQKDYDGLQTDYRYSVQIKTKDGAYVTEHKERKERLKTASVIGMIEHNSDGSIVAIVMEEHKGFEDEDFVSVKYLFSKKNR
jgi:hypothetical protein